MYSIKGITDLDVAVRDLCEQLDSQRSKVAEGMIPYVNGAVTADTLKDWKADRAKINKERTAVDNERKSLEREWKSKLAPVSDAYKDIVSEYQKAIDSIDTQLASFEEQRRAEKMQEILQHWAMAAVPLSLVGWLDLDDVMTDRWLNATYQMSDIDREITDYISNLKLSYDTIASMNSRYIKEGLEKLRETKDLRDAVAEMNLLQTMEEQIKAKMEIEAAARRKAEEEAREREQVEAIRKAEEKARADERAKIELEDANKMVEFSFYDTAEEIEFRLAEDEPEYRVIKIMVKDENSEKLMQILRNCEYVEDVWEE